jgi:antitoxin component YwqK of YwqJK toxin-antitoxin module
MKITLIIPFIFFLNSINSQVKFKYPHCNCEDIIEQAEPTLNGTYKRVCNGIVIEQGLFLNGNKDGNWKSWSKTGKLIKNINYSNGKLIGTFQLFYLNGKKKFTGSFNNGMKDGVWSYFNNKEKVIKTGLYENGTPRGIWKIYDFKGKNELIVYNYDDSSYISNSEDVLYFEPNAIIQNENSEEWFIRHQFNKHEKNKIKPIEGFLLSNDFYTNLIEIPYEIWDTYFQHDLTTEVTFNNKEISTIQIDTSITNDIVKPTYTFLISTNSEDKLSKVEHTEFTKKLLEHKLIETLWLMGPWIGVGESQKIRATFVINKFKESPYH